MESSEFTKLLDTCQKIATDYREGVVFSGGIAVYLHSINNSSTSKYAEFTHDADFFISLADMADLRDNEEVVPNRRLNKHQIIKNGFSFDIYTERHSSLLVPFDQIIAHSTKYESLKVACLEHLLVLKLAAYEDRQQSTKGQKDAKNIIRLLIVAASQKKKLNEDLIISYLGDEHLDFIKIIGKSSEFLSLTKGNAHSAKELRDIYNKVAKGIL